jgi:hypothetical protein
MAVITHRVRHERSTTWETGYQWRVEIFVDGHLRRERFQVATRRAAQREGAKFAREILDGFFADEARLAALVAKGKRLSERAAARGVEVK